MPPYVNQRIETMTRGAQATVTLDPGVVVGHDACQMEINQQRCVELVADRQD